MHTLNKDDGALTTFNHEAQSYCTRKCCICCILILLVVTMQLEYYNYQYNRHIATPITQVTQIVQDSSWLDKDVNLTSLMIPPTMPALVILGPAKTGTSSLALNLNQYVDIVWYGSEHPYWTTRACLNQDLTHDQWKTFINDFIDPNKNIKLSSIASNFVAGFANDTTKTDCSVNFFYTNWLTLKAAKDASNRRCIHPQIFLGRDAANIKEYGSWMQKYGTKRNNTINDTLIERDKNLPVCWFFEKAPIYVRKAYRTSIIFSNFLPKIKTFMLVRNPIKHMISYTSIQYKKSHIHIDDDDKKISKKESLEQWMYNFLQTKYNTIDSNTNETIGYSAVIQQCNLFADKLKFEFDHENEKWIVQQYKQFIGAYLYQAKVLNVIFSRDILDRQESMFAATVIFPAVLMFVYNYDEKFGYKNWNNFRIIQFEWLYSKHMNDALSMIKCWLQTDDDMKQSFDFSMHSNKKINHGNNDKAFYQSYNKCPKVFFNSKKYYKHVSNILIDKIPEKKVSWAIQDDISKQYKQFFIDFFTPCNNALSVLIQHRPEVLLGLWKPWSW